MGYAADVAIFFNRLKSRSATELLLAERVEMPVIILELSQIPNPVHQCQYRNHHPSHRNPKHGSPRQCYNPIENPLDSEELLTRRWPVNRIISTNNNNNNIPRLDLRLSRSPKVSSFLGHKGGWKVTPESPKDGQTPRIRTNFQPVKLKLHPPSSGIDLDGFKGKIAIIPEVFAK